MMGDMNATYKILKLLSKYRGKEDFDYELISAKAVKMDVDQWEQLMIALQKAGYIEGLVYTQSMSQKFPHIVEPIHPLITFNGMEYLENNGTMAKAKEALALIGEFIP